MLFPQAAHPRIHSNQLPLDPQSDARDVRRSDSCCLIHGTGLHEHLTHETVDSHWPNLIGSFSPNQRNLLTHAEQAVPPELDDMVKSGVSALNAIEAVGDIAELAADGASESMNCLLVVSFRR